ncbi:hypothetical protein [Actinomycetospora aeridis]|uniref:Uncharacterized protein n=1 Tax=Actinomycetospora aeridis TaxID=3129231 RepID=A0ABU8NB91_9PSEU
MDWANQTGSRERTPYRVRPATRDHHGRMTTPPGIHLAGVGDGNGPAHGRPRSRITTVASSVGAALIVFVLGLLLVTGIEAVIGQPLSGGHDGHTTLGELFHPTR